MHVKSCDCKTDKFGNPQGAAYQDKKLGKGERYHTLKAKSDKQPQKYVCTVCGKQT